MGGALRQGALLALRVRGRARPRELRGLPKSAVRRMARHAKPLMSDEEFDADIGNRLKNLKAREARASPARIDAGRAYRDTR